MELKKKSDILTDPHKEKKIVPPLKFSENKNNNVL